MNLLVTWAPDIASLLPTDTFNVYYKEADPLNLNTWILANLTPLPSTATSYTITGLTPNTVYRVAVEKTCVGSPSVFVQEYSVTHAGCPIYSYYQGPFINGYPTLFYSVSYPDSNNVQSIGSLLYDISNVDYNFIPGCNQVVNPCANISFPIGRGVRVDRFCPNCNPPGESTSFICGLDWLKFNYPSNLVSAVGYLGLAPSPNNNNLSQYCPAGSGVSGQPILLGYGNEYRFGLFQPNVGIIPSPPYTFPGSGSNVLFDTAECYSNTIGKPSITIAPFVFDSSRLSGVQDYNTVTGLVRQVIIDGTNQTAINGSINHYQFSYTVEDAFSNTFPLLNSNGTAVTTPSISYTRHAPILVSILPAQLTAGMDIICRTLNPAPSIVLNVTGANYAGVSVANFCISIANQLTAAGYPSDHVVYGGQNYIRFGLPDPIFTGAQIEVTGPAPVFASYNNNVYGLLNTSLNSAPWITNDDVTASTVNGYTIGQYKVLTDDTWQSIPGGLNITVNANDTLEFVMFDTDVELYEVENVTTSTVYDLTNNLNLNTLPTFTDINSVTVFSIKCDSVNLTNGDVLEFRFTNPFATALPFVNTVTINF
jgi:hypothetical protein